MKKKLLSVMIALTALFSLSFATAACSSGGKGDSSVSVTLHANGGEFSDSLTEYSLTRGKGAAIGSVPVPKREGYVFEGWTTEENGSLMWTAEDALKSNVTLYAKWAEKVTITYDGNGGGFADGETVFCEDIKISTAARQPEQPVRENFEFGGWYLGGKDGDKVTLSTEYDFTKTVDDDLTLYAKWDIGSGVRLAAPSVTVEYGVFSWNEIEGAKSYDYIIEDAEGVEKENNKCYGTEFTFPTFYPDGNYKVKVRANGDGINTVNSAYSTAVNFSARTLSDVNASVGLSDSVLGWEVTNTKYVKPDSYDLYIYSYPYVPDTAPVYSGEKLTVTSFDMSGYQAGDYVVKIIANKQNYTSSESIVTVNKNRLATPVAGISADDDFAKFDVSWKEVACADTYIITVGDTEYETEKLNCKIERGDGYSWDNSVIYVPASQETVTLSAFDSKHDHLISQPQELTLPQKTGIAKLTVTNDDSDAGSVTVSGGAYVYQQPPYKITYNLASNMFYQGRIYDPENFYYKGGTLPENETLEEGDTIEYPVQIPVCSTSRPVYAYNESGKAVCSYFVFRGWFTDSAATEFYDFDAPVTGDTVIYAGWHKIPVDMFYDCDVMHLSDTSRGVDFYCKRYYFISLKDATYKFIYKKTETRGTNTFTVTNLTQGTTILESSLTETGTREYTFSAKKGDVIYFDGTAANGQFLNCRVETTDNRTLLLPAAKGKAAPASYTYASTSSATELFAVKGKTVTLTATEETKGSFLGWFDASGNKVSDKLELTVTVTADVTYTAKWNPAETN